MRVLLVSMLVSMAFAGQAQKNKERSAWFWRWLDKSTYKIDSSQIRLEANEQILDVAARLYERGHLQEVIDTLTGACAPEVLKLDERRVYYKLLSEAYFFTAMDSLADRSTRKWLWWDPTLQTYKLSVDSPELLQHVRRYKVRNFAFAHQQGLGFDVLTLKSPARNAPGTDPGVTTTYRNARTYTHGIGVRTDIQPVRLEFWINRHFQRLDMEERSTVDGFNVSIAAEEIKSFLSPTVFIGYGGMSLRYPIERLNWFIKAGFSVDYLERLCWKSPRVSDELELGALCRTPAKCCFQSTVDDRMFSSVHLVTTWEFWKNKWSINADLGFTRAFHEDLKFEYPSLHYISDPLKRSVFFFQLGVAYNRLRVRRAAG